MTDGDRPMGDWVAVLALVLSAALLCLIVYQDMQVGAAGEALTYLREHCQILP